MKLLYPEFLYALAFLIIPILIHLFNFRRYKVVRFSQVRFLQNIQKQTQSTSKLKHWLVLLSRCLAIAALVLAFCQPFIPKQGVTDQRGTKGVSIYIDNSFSMEAVAESGQLLDLAKNRAIATVSAFDASDKFQLLTNEFKGKHQRWLNKEAFIEMLQEVEVSPVFRTLDEVVRRQNAMYEEHDYVEKRFVISDLQKNSFVVEAIEDSVDINLIPLLAETQANISLDSIYFSKPYRGKDLEEEVRFKLTNYGDEKAEQIPVKLQLNQQLKTPLQLSVDANDTAWSQLSFRSSAQKWQSGLLSLKDYPVTFDDSLFFAFEVKSNVQLLHIYQTEANPGIKKLFSADSFMVYQSEPIDQVNFNGFGKYDFIIVEGVKTISSGLQQELSKYVTQGGSIAIFPSAELDIATYNLLLNKLRIDGYENFVTQEIGVSNLNVESEIYRDVFEETPQRIDLPKVKAYWKVSQLSQSKRENLLSLQNGQSFLSLYEIENGKLYLAASPLSEEASNFTAHAIFVPTLYNMALQSQTTAPPFYFLDEGKILLNGVEEKESPVRIVNQQIDYIPAQRFQGSQLSLELGGQLKKAGHYQLKQGEEQIGIVAFNYSRKESNLARYELSEIENIAEQSKVKLEVYDYADESLINLISEREKGKSLWKYFIILALVFLGVEIALLRLLK